MYSIFIVLCLVGTAFAQCVKFGYCPTSEKYIFNTAKFLGRWYIAESFDSDSGKRTKCESLDYIIGSDGNIGVLNIRISKSTGRLFADIGRIYPTGWNLMQIEFDTSYTGRMSYWVLGTDYNSFSIVVYCKCWVFLYYKSIFILTRARNPDASIIAKADAIIAKNKLDRSNALKIDQTDCNIRYT